VGWLALVGSTQRAYIHHAHPRPFAVTVVTFVIIVATGLLTLRWRWMLWLVTATRIVTAVSSVIGPVVWNRTLPLAVLGTALMVGSCYLTLVALMIDRRDARQRRQMLGTGGR
jgi:hypothetical protein